MPTGYTASIKDGITFEKFIWNCARSFGALVEMKDEPIDAPIPEEFQTSNFYAEELKKAQSHYEELKTMDSIDAENAAGREYQDELQREMKYKEDAFVLKEKYLAMLTQVKQWQQPSLEHTGLKSFMIEQIEISIEFDCSNLERNILPIRLTGDEWFKKEKEKTLRHINYMLTEKNKEEERTAGRNLWLKQLRESLSS